MNEAASDPQKNFSASEKFSRFLHKHWKRLFAVLLGAGGALLFGVYDNLKGGIVEYASDSLRYYFLNPVYIIEFTKPVIVNKDKFALLPVRGNGEMAKLAYVNVLASSANDDQARYIEVTAYPGLYYIRLERALGTSTQVLAQQIISLGKPNEPVKVDTSDSQWATVAALTTPQNGAKVTGTRWTLAPSDNDALAASDGRSAAILRAALSQLGTWERGGDADKRAIDSYWKATRAADGASYVKESDPMYGLWGGAFLAWAVTQSGGTPPRNAAGFPSWQDWGNSVRPSNAKPGAIVIVHTKNRQPPTPSGLTVGVFLRQQSDCVEMVTGNLADRVVITCVQGRVLSFRSSD